MAVLNKGGATRLALKILAAAHHGGQGPPPPFGECISIGAFETLDLSDLTELDDTSDQVATLSLTSHSGYR